MQLELKYTLCGYHSTVINIWIESVLTVPYQYRYRTVPVPCPVPDLGWLGLVGRASCRLSSAIAAQAGQRVLEERGAAHPCIK